MPKTSLATRIALLVILVLALGMGISGLLLVRSVREAQKKSIDGRLNARLAWLESAMDADYEEGKLELEARGSPPGLAQMWSVTTVDNRLLWSGKQPETRPKHMAKRERKLIFGEDDWPLAKGMDLRKGMEIETGEKDSEWRYGQDPNRQVFIYRFSPRKVRLVLILRAAVDISRMHEEIEYLRTSLAIGIPLAVIALGVIMALLVRLQLRPLRQMADEAANIGPEDLAARISDGDTSRECGQLRDALNRMIERMAQGIQRERLFAQAAAHELRTPLAQLRTQIELTLRRERVGGEYRQALRGINEDAVRIEQLIKGLLLLTKSGSRQATCTHRASLKIILQDICASDRRLPPPDLPEADHLWVMGEESLLRTAIMNVLQNALEYAPAAPPQMRISATARMLKLEITDQGPGIPPEEHARIFEPLVRLDPARTIRPDAGFGLGLAITRNILRAFGGDIVCEAREDREGGARFVLRFLLAP